MFLIVEVLVIHSLLNTIFNLCWESVFIYIYISVFHAFCIFRHITYATHCTLTALPKPPTSLVISEVTATSIKLTWASGNVDPISSYIIQYKRKFPVGDPYAIIENIRHRMYTIIGLDPHTQYEFRVVAVNHIGRGIPSNPVDVTTGEQGESFKWVLSEYMLN